MTYHSAITGKFVTKKYAEANPETTVKLSHVNLREELIEFLEWQNEYSGFSNEDLADKYLKEKGL